MQKIQPLENGLYYHIYNRGINSCNIFNSDGYYEYFLKLYDKYLCSVVDTFAWVLMPNHFHFLVRIKEKENTVSTNTPDRVLNPVRGQVKPSQHFSNLFNAYAQAYNKQNQRHGSLFERPFKRKLIDSEEYLKRVLIYIHNNPVHHGFTENIEEYRWSSYISYISDKPSRIKRKVVIDWFEDISNFKYLHKPDLELNELDRRLGI